MIFRLKGMPLAASANAHFKAWRVERDAAATRRRYAQQARRSNLRIPAGDDLKSALAVRVGARAAALKWPKPPGGLHIFLVYSHCNWESILPEALAGFGEVTVFEYGAAGFDQGSRDWLARRGEMNESLWRSFAAAHARRPVDLMVGYFSGYTVDPDVLARMMKAGAITTNFCFDDKIRWPGSILGGRYASTASIAHAIDLNLTSDPEGMVRYFAHGGLSMFHPEAADPNFYRPLDIGFAHDVSFVGACYGWRPKLVQGLKRRGVKVACFGKGWPGGALPNGDMNRIYAESRINLGCGGIGYSKNLLCLKGRDFEVPMSGAVYLTQNNPELAQVFALGEEILVYDDIDDCARRIREILGNPDRAARIRRAARERSLREHTYAARWEKVLHTLGALA